MKIFVSRNIPGSALDKLKSSGNEVKISEFDRPLTPEEFLEGAKGADAVLSVPDSGDSPTRMFEA